MIGHSAGGGDVQDIAQALNDRGINNVITVQIDSVEPFGDDASVPSNVRKAVNIFQTISSGLSGRLVRGESTIVADDPLKTTIVNQNFSGLSSQTITGNPDQDEQLRSVFGDTPVFPLLNNSGEPISPQVDPRFDTTAAHRNIDNDPRVLRFIAKELSPLLVDPRQGI